MVAYLESLSDLTIRLEASDATSKEATTALLRSIPLPLGGCMLLTVVLSDRTFAFQDDEGFQKVFASKTGACGVLESSLPGGVAALDFFITFSSVVGLFGNGGQTNYSRSAVLSGFMTFTA
jgi:KR domain